MGHCLAVWRTQTGENMTSVHELGLQIQFEILIESSLCVEQLNDEAGNTKLLNTYKVPGIGWILFAVDYFLLGSYWDSFHLMHQLKYFHGPSTYLICYASFEIESDQ